MPDRPNLPRRPGSQSEIAVDQQPERGAVNHPGVDGVAQAIPRKSTLVGMGASRPSGEFSPTLPAPAQPTLKKTWRVPTPPSAVLLARRSDPPATSEATGPKTRPAGKPESALPPPSQTPAAASLEATRRRAESAEAELAELKRQARVQAEAKRPAASFPPPVVRSPVAPKPVPEPDSTAVISWLVKRGVDNRKAIYAIVAALSIGGGGVAIKTATEKPQPAPLTAAQLDAALDRLKTRKGGFDDQVRLANEQLQLTKCLRRKVTQIGESVLPAPDHTGAARKIQPFDDDCPDNPRPLPDP